MEKTLCIFIWIILAASKSLILVLTPSGISLMPWQVESKDTSTHWWYLGLNLTIALLLAYRLGRSRSVGGALVYVEEAFPWKLVAVNFSREKAFPHK